MTRYDRFAEDSEHDWVVFIFAGYSFEWHTEYRNADGTGLSPDPADPMKTFRVLTLYVAEDLLAKKSQLSIAKQQSDPIETASSPVRHPDILNGLAQDAWQLHQKTY